MRKEKERKIFLEVFTKHGENLLCSVIHSVTMHLIVILSFPTENHEYCGSKGGKMMDGGAFLVCKCCKVGTNALSLSEETVYYELKTWIMEKTIRDYLFMCFLFVSMGLFAQNDRKTFDLNGNVKVCVSSAADNGYVLPSLRAEFSEDGKLIKLGGFDMTKDNGSYSIERDKEGRIVRVEFQAGDAERVNRISYDAEGRVAEVKNYDVNIDTDEEMLNNRMVRTYDSKGLPAKETYYNEDGNEMAVYTYTYKKVDENGNWVVRLVSEPSQALEGAEETRELTAEAVAEEPAANAQQSVTADFSNDLDKAMAANRSAKKSAKSIAQEIVLALLFVLLFGHSLFELYIKKPKLVKLQANTPPANWDEQQEIALIQKLDEVVDQNCTSFAPLGYDYSVPTTRQQLKNIKEAMFQVAETQLCNPDVVAHYNEKVDALNALEKRTFGGSKAYLIVGGIIVAIIAVVRMCDGAILQGLFYFLFSFGAYWLGSQRHTYQLMALELKGSRGAGFLTALLGGIFAFMGSGKTYITTYLNELGQPVAQDEDNSEHVMYPALGLILIAVIGMFMPFVGLVNYVRFYIIHR